MTSPTSPTTPTAAPAVPDRSSRATFSSRATAFFDFLKNIFIGEMSGLASNAYTNATSAYESATAASASSTAAAAAQLAAETAANAQKWVSGTTYVIGDVRWSPIDYQSYRRKTAGAGTTDPSADTTNWALVRAGSGLIYIKSYDAAGVADLSIEDLSGYGEFVIQFDNLAPSAASDVTFKIKKSGAYVSGTYKVLSTRNDGTTASQNFSSGSSSISIGNLSSAVFSGEIRLKRVSNTSNQSIRIDYAAFSSSGANVGASCATEATAAAIQGIRASVSSGTFTSGTFTLFAVAAH